MKTLKNILFCCFIGVLSISCKQQQSIEYDLEVLDSKSTTDATLIKIGSEIKFGNPSTIDFISDSIMVVYDENVNEYIAHVIDVEGHHINSFGRKGHGEGEIVSPINIAINEEGDSAFIYDFMMQRMVGYDLNKVMNNIDQRPSITEFDISTIPGQEYRFTHVKIGPNKNMLGFSSGVNRIVSMKDGKVQSTYTDYPLVDTDVETNWSIWNYSQDRKSISPDKRKLVIATYVGGLFEIFDIRNDNISSRTVKGFYKPDYKYAEGAIPKSVSPNPETMVTGFRSINVGNEDFAAVLDGPQTSRNNEILIFDFDGNLKERLVVDNGIINRIGRSKNGDMYVIAFDKDFEGIDLYRVEKGE